MCIGNNNSFFDFTKESCFIFGVPGTNNFFSDQYCREQGSDTARSTVSKENNNILFYPGVNSQSPQSYKLHPAW